MVVEYFANSYTDPSLGNNVNDMARDRFPRMSQEMHACLAKLFSASKVWVAVSSMSLFKAPSPDGY